MTLEEFLLAQIAEDEAKAQALRARAAQLLDEMGGDRLAALEVWRFEMAAELHQEERKP